MQLPQSTYGTFSPTSQSLVVLLVAADPSHCQNTTDLDSELRLPERIPRKLETVYHRLRLNAALTNSYRHRLGLTANPYCNCGLPETVEHVLLECPAYSQERSHLAQ